MNSGQIFQIHFVLPFVEKFNIQLLCKIKENIQYFCSSCIHYLRSGTVRAESESVVARDTRGIRT